MPLMERMAALKRAKALRHTYGNVGIVAEYSIDVPVGVWDEILNQILFLLTL